jgi:lipoprotein-releasing system ATP-binding protein
MISTTSIVEAINIGKRYQTAGTAAVDVFSDINLEIKQGELVALTGPSGSGKSTLLHLLGTLDKPSAGSIRLEDQDVLSFDDKELSQFRNRRIGFIFQFHHLLPEFTALENVAMPALIAGESIKSVEPRAKALLDEVGLRGRSDHRPAALSGGESQRVAVARAFIMHPALVLADEPTGNLDLKNSEMLFDLILGLSRAHTQTFFIATHNLELAARADRTLHLEAGLLR